MVLFLVLNAAGFYFRYGADDFWVGNLFFGLGLIEAFVFGVGVDRGWFGERMPDPEGPRS